MARASRKRRLPISSAKGRSALFAFSDDAWRRCSDAYGVPLPDAFRDDVEAALTHYLDVEPFGRSAPFADGASEWLACVEKAAHGFTASLSARGGGGARAYAESVLAEHLSSTLPEGEDGERPMTRVARLMREIAIAAALARAEIEDEDAPRLDERTAWRSLMIRIWRAATTHGLPTAVNKSGIRRSKTEGVTDATSPFVRFVAAVQEALPADLRRHDHSLGTLATEIAKAVKAAREFRTPES